MQAPKRFAAEIELDLGRYELRRNGRRLKLEKKPMELLILLVTRREQLVSRQEIVAKLWRSDLFIDTEPNINNIVRKIRAALGDNPDKPRFLETVIGKGYRFVGPVRVIEARFPSTDSERSTAHEKNGEVAQATGGRTSLAVLPLLLLPGVEDDQGLCLGFADALVSRLGNLQGVDVLPTSAVLNVPAESSASEASARLGVRFIVHGAIRNSKGQLRLSLEMFDAHSQRASLSRKCDIQLPRLMELENEFATQIANALNRPLHPLAEQQRPRYSKEPMAYAEFMRGYRLSSSGDPNLLEQAAQHLSAAVARDPKFSLAHATLSYVCATQHFEFDPASQWLEKAEFHCRRALELDSDLPEAHVANAFLLWGPSKNFQHVEAIVELKRALAHQSNLPHAYNRLGTILAHIGLLDQAREMYERGRPFHPQRAVSHSIVQAYLWNLDYDLAGEEIEVWRAENPGSKYPLYYASHLALLTQNWSEAKALLDEAVTLLPREPLTLSLRGLLFALTGKELQAMECVTLACASPKSFGHSHHTYYQIASTLAVLKRPLEAFEWLERSVSTGFACWPFFMKDPCLENLRNLREFEILVSSLQARYPAHLGIL